MTIAQIRARAGRLLTAARHRVPVLDHAIRAVGYTNETSGFQLAAGITYYAFLSFFPLVALAYAVVGFVVDYVPGARQAVTDVLVRVLPTMVGDAPGQLDVTRMAEAKAGVGVVGLVGLLYAGLGWISSLRTSLELVFSGPGEDRPRRGFVATRLADVRGLFVIGVGLLVGIGFGGVLTAGAERVAAAIGLPGSRLLVLLLTELLVIGTMTVVVYATFRLLPARAPGNRGLLTGSLLVAVGFEVLRQLATLIVGQFTANPLYGAFAVLVALLVWINYTARLLIVAAAWAVTAVDGHERRTGPAATPAR